MRQLSTGSVVTAYLNTRLRLSAMVSVGVAEAADLRRQARRKPVGMKNCRILFLAKVKQITLERTAVAPNMSSGWTVAGLACNAELRDFGVPEAGKRSGLTECRVAMDAVVIPELAYTSAAGWYKEYRGPRDPSLFSEQVN